MTPHHGFEVRVYYEDTDFSGAVYHAAYLHFLERGRTEFLRAHGIHHSRLLQSGITFAVRSLEVEFFRPAHIDDLLLVETTVVDIGGVRLTLRQSIGREGTPLAMAHVVVVAVKGDRPVRLPAELRHAFGAERAESKS